MADDDRPPAPTPGSQELDQPTASPDADATPEGESDAALTAAVAEDVKEGKEGKEPPGRSAAMVVAAGIFLSRIIGFVRERAVGFFFGVGEHADVFRVALRMPNVLQNLLGEGTVSAAFIPIYSRMLEEGRAEDAGRFAGAVLGLLTALVAVLVGLGVLLAEQITTVLQPGFLGDAERLQAGEVAVDRFQLAVQTVRITFPMAGLLVLSAWALGVLNSHRKFFLPYVAPVLWNVAIIGALIFAARTLFDSPGDVGQLDVIPVATLNRLLFAGLFGALLGGLLQFGVQLPLVFRVIRGFRFSFSTQVDGVKQSFRAFLPVLAGRGVYQISGYLDLLLAGFLAAGAIAALANAQVLYMLPVSLFAMSVAASELPELSRLSAAGRGEFLARVDRSIRQIAFMVVPSVVAFVGFGFLVVAALYRTGRFGLEANYLVSFVLAAYALGLIATTTSRLLQNAFYALDDTKTPAKVAVLRVVLSTAIGAALMFWLDRFSVPELVGIPATGRPLRMGAVGLAVGASVGAWVELAALRRSLGRKLPGFRLPWGRILTMLGVACLAAMPAMAVRWLVPVEPIPILLFSVGVLAVYGVSYLGLAVAFGFEEGEVWTGRLLRRFKRKG